MKFVLIDILFSGSDIRIDQTMDYPKQLDLDCGAEYQIYVFNKALQMFNMVF